jgi:hypothetical protein
MSHAPVAGLARPWTRFYANYGRNTPRLVKRQDARRDAAAPRRLAARIAELEAENRALRAERWVYCG